MERPLWLPAMEPVEGPVEGVLRRLYQRFLADFRTSACQFKGLPVGWDQASVVILGQLIDGGFWHLVSREDQKAKARKFDPRRAERMVWCSPLLRNADDDQVLVWQYREGHGRTRTYVWLERWDYVVVLEERSTHAGTVMQLVTAFYVDGRATTRAFRRKYELRIR